MGGWGHVCWDSLLIDVDELGVHNLAVDLHHGHLITRVVASVQLMGQGLLTNSILFCWIFTIKDQFKNQNYQDLRQLALNRQFPGTSVPSKIHLIVSLYL